MPFYSWQCITLQLNHRDVDLVIRDEQDMNKFLKLIINKMKTVDGNKDSAIGILNLINSGEGRKSSIVSKTASKVSKTGSKPGGQSPLAEH